MIGDERRREILHDDCCYCCCHSPSHLHVGEVLTDAIAKNSAVAHQKIATIELALGKQRTGREGGRSRRSTALSGSILRLCLDVIQGIHGV